MFRAAEGGLGVDDPVAPVTGGEPSPEGLGVGQSRRAAAQGQQAGLVGVAEAGQELPAEEPAQHLDRQEEAALTGDPVLAVP